MDIEWLAASMREANSLEGPSKAVVSEPDVRAQVADAYSSWLLHVESNERDSATAVAPVASSLPPSAAPRPP